LAHTTCLPLPSSSFLFLPLPSSSFLFLPLQARIDVGAETIVGLNKYRLEEEDPIEVRSNTIIDNKTLLI
jgi:hypothetical protein